MPEQKKPKYPPKGLDTKMPFGKYKGDTLDLIINTDPTYIWWCIENVDGFELDNEAYETLKRISKAQ